MWSPTFGCPLTRGAGAVSSRHVVGGVTLMHTWAFLFRKGCEDPGATLRDVSPQLNARARPTTTTDEDYSKSAQCNRAAAVAATAAQSRWKFTTVGGGVMNLGWIIWVSWQVLPTSTLSRCCLSLFCWSTSGVPRASTLRCIEEALKQSQL